MKVLLFNGSSRKNGCTYMALSEVADILNHESIETDILQMGSSTVRECIGCDKCAENSRCIFSYDIVNSWLGKADKADGFVFGSPVYYAHPTGQLLSLLDRMFYAGSSYFYHKPAAAVVSARRAGTTASLDVLNKYFADAHMLMVGSSYWNMVHGMTPEQVKQDNEGLQTIRNLGRNMAWLLKCIEAGKSAGIFPPRVEREHWTNFIR